MLLPGRIATTSTSTRVRAEFTDSIASSSTSMPSQAQPLELIALSTNSSAALPTEPPAIRSLVQNHIYKLESAEGDTSCAAYRMDQELKRSGFDPVRYPWSMVRQGTAVDRPEVLYGTAYAQKVLWEHQHPANCSNASFLMYSAHTAGMGSQLHWMGQALALAMNLGRVLVLSPEDKNVKLYDSTFCPDASGYECWLQNITSCHVGDQDVLQLHGHPKMEREPAENFGLQSVPVLFHEMLANCSPIKSKSWFYWWRSQSVTYLVRFNDKTREALDRFRSESLYTCHAQKPSPAHVLSPGYISAHIRQGEKSSEAQLFPFIAYLKQMRALVDNSSDLRVLFKEVAESDTNFSYPSGAYSERKMFLSTEDQLTVLRALSLCSAHPPWQVSWTKVNRGKLLSRLDPWMHLTSEQAAREQALIAFMNLELALEADAWVCALTSNWCRLIDELRMTVGMKASKPYLSLSTHGKTKQPCPPEEPQCYLCY
ncbi:FucT6 [Symbiodinium sp. CCMP2456]|nr:FucT6 [Symbiodinium sp. CCMP2456]